MSQLDEVNDNMSPEMNATPDLSPKTGILIGDSLRTETSSSKFSEGYMMSQRSKSNKSTTVILNPDPQYYYSDEQGAVRGSASPLSPNHFGVSGGSKVTGGSSSSREQGKSNSRSKSNTNSIKNVAADHEHVATSSCGSRSKSKSSLQAFTRNEEDEIPTQRRTSSELEKEFPSRVPSASTDPNAPSSNHSNQHSGSDVEQLIHQKIEVLPTIRSGPASPASGGSTQFIPPYTGNLSVSSVSSKITSTTLVDVYKYIWHPRFSYTFSDGRSQQEIYSCFRSLPEHLLKAEGVSKSGSTNILPVGAGNSSNPLNPGSYESILPHVVSHVTIEESHSPRGGAFGFGDGRSDCGRTGGSRCEESTGDMTHGTHGFGSSDLATPDLDVIDGIQKLDNINDKDLVLNNEESCTTVIFENPLDFPDVRAYLCENMGWYAAGHEYTPSKERMLKPKVGDPFMEPLCQKVRVPVSKLPLHWDQVAPIATSFGDRMRDLFKELMTGWF